MASNPMQRKARNSFLLGIIITLLITGGVIVLLVMQIKQKADQIEKYESEKKSVYVLSDNVKSQEVLTKNSFVLKDIHQDSIPKKAASVEAEIESWFLKTKDDEYIYYDGHFDKYLNDSNRGYYIKSDAKLKYIDNIIEVYTHDGRINLSDYKGNKIKKDEKYVIKYSEDSDGKIEKLNSEDVKRILKDDDGEFIINLDAEDKLTRVYKNPITSEFYFYELDKESITASAPKRFQRVIDIKNVPIVAKVDMDKNTVITEDLVVQMDDIVNDDTREEQFNMITLPIDLMTGDYVDIRVKFANGQDFIIASKVKVVIPENYDGTYSPTAVQVNLDEIEILSMSSAIVEVYGYKGSEIYMSKYVDPAMQKPSIPTYAPSEATLKQIRENPNIVMTAKKEMDNRYNEAAQFVRNEINKIEPDDYKDGIEDMKEKELEKAIKERQKYLDAITAAASAE